MTNKLKPALLALALPALMTACASVDETQPAELADQATAAPASTESAEASDNSQGIICKKQKVTGSRFTKKVCTTAAQREKAAKRSKEILNKVQGSSVLTNMEGG